MGMGASGRAAPGSIAGSVAASSEAVKVGKEFSVFTVLVEAAISAEVLTAAFGADKETVAASCG
jgi:hypothetical protein